MLVNQGSIEVLQQFGNGTTLFGGTPMWNGIVDVRDVADAHVAAAINPAAKGRYEPCVVELYYSKWVRH